MRVLAACEFSGTVRDAFAARGHDAWSCDLLPSDKPGNHIQGDVLDILEDGWDLMIAHPPCTYLCSSGLHWNKRVEGRDQKTHEAMLFVLNLMGEGFIDNPIPRIALENPIGRIGTAYRKADQIIHPHEFGHDASKSTCLWLKNLPLLQPTKLVLPGYGCPTCKIRFGYELGKYGWPNNGDNPHCHFCTKESTNGKALQKEKDRDRLPRKGCRSVTRGTAQERDPRAETSGQGEVSRTHGEPSAES